MEFDRSEATTSNVMAVAGCQLSRRHTIPPAAVKAASRTPDTVVASSVTTTGSLPTQTRTSAQLARLR